MVETLVNIWDSFVAYIQTVAKYLLDGVLYVLKACFFFIFDGLLTVITAVVGSLDLSTVAFNSAAQWGMLPPQALYLIDALAIPQCISMMIYAILIRMLINLIPAEFTRL